MEMLTIDTPMAPPAWARLERELIDAQTRACREFFEKYYDNESGYLLCVPRWGGNDGPDDAAENQLNWTMLHALGAPDDILEMFKKGWESHLKQYTEARTVEVPMAREGMFHKEFIVMFDWFHNAEWLSAHTLQGLSDPLDPAYLARHRRYAGFYMGDDPEADNWDPEHKLIRSMFNGSRGPLMRKATALEWAGDPIDVGKFLAGHGERTFDDMLHHFEAFSDVVGDHPLNLGTTVLAFNVYALTGETRYRDWILEYVDAWLDRTEANGGLTPSNVGLDGTPGGACDGKWWGGAYGWGFQFWSPGSGRMSYSPVFQRSTPYGFANALLLTGERRYAQAWGKQIDIINAGAREEDGQTVYPHSYGDEGWCNFSGKPFSTGALEVYYWTMDEQDRPRVGDNAWLDFLGGSNPDYPETALQRDRTQLETKLTRMREDTTTPETRLSDNMNGINPATTAALTQLMLGGLPTGRTGYPLHCRVRYFDTGRRRAGIPQETAALVEHMTADEVEIVLVNLDTDKACELVIQGGAYGEHQILTASVNGQAVPVGGRNISVRLAGGCGGRVKLTMQRYANQPTFDFPWT